MLFYLFGAAITIVATVFISKTARENRRSGILWALISLTVGFGCQIVLPIVGAIIIAAIYLATGTSQMELPNKIGGAAELLFYLLWVLSFVLLFLVLKFVANPTAASLAANEMPPPPPEFG
jgi:MFS family permease